MNDLRLIQDKENTKNYFRIIMLAIYFAFLSVLLINSNKKPVIPPCPKPAVSVTPKITPTPTPIKKHVWKGWVSHYSRAGCLGCSATLTMANGETLDDNRLTIAFNWLPMNTKVRMTNLSNGKEVIATVTDTGGFNKLNRIADLTPAVHAALETKTDNSIVEIEEL